MGTRKKTKTSTKKTLVRFEATVQAVAGNAVLRLPTAASKKLPSRGQVSVEGTINTTRFQMVIEPDGNSGHWMKLPQKLQKRAGVGPDDAVAVELEPTKVWPEPEVPQDLREALENAPNSTRDLWKAITPMARWEWVRWVNATRNAKTRQRRVEVSISKLNDGKRRPCCFNLASCTDPELARSGKLVLD